MFPDDIPGNPTADVEVRCAPDGTVKHIVLLLRIDTPIEVDYYLHGGILPFVLRDLMANAPAAQKVTA